MTPTYLQRYSWIAAIAVAIGFQGLLSGASEARPLEEIKSSGEIRYCVFAIAADVGQVDPPGCLGEGCSFDGPVRQLTEAFAQHLGVSTTYYVPTWDEQFHNQDGVTVREASYTPALMESGKCDAYPSNLIRNEWRMKKLVQVTVFPSRDVVVIDKARQGDFGSLDDLAGRTAALVESSAQHSLIDKENATTFKDNPVTITFVPSVEDEFKAIAAGKVDFGVVPAYSAYPPLRTAYPTLVAPFPIGPITEHTWAFRNEDIGLQDAFSQWINEQQTDGGSVFSKMFTEQYGISYPNHLRLVTRIK